MIRRYCTCGASLQARSTPAVTAEALADEFDRRHRSADCEPATAAVAARARSRADALALAAEVAEWNREGVA